MGAEAQRARVWLSAGAGCPTAVPTFPRLHFRMETSRKWSSYVEAASREGSSGAGSNLRACVCVFVSCSSVVLQGGFWYRVGIAASAAGTFYREKTLCSSAALFPHTNSGNWVEKRFRSRIVPIRENSTGLTWPLWWQSALSDHGWLQLHPQRVGCVCTSVRKWRGVALSETVSQKAIAGISLKPTWKTASLDVVDILMCKVREKTKNKNLTHLVRQELIWNNYLRGAIIWQPKWCWSTLELVPHVPFPWPARVLQSSGCSERHLFQTALFFFCSDKGFSSYLLDVFWDIMNIIDQMFNCNLRSTGGNMFQETRSRS